MDDYRFTATVRTSYRAPGAIEDAAARLLQLLVGSHAGLGPVTDADLREKTLSATIAFDASGLDLNEAIRRGADIISTAMREANVDAHEIVDAHLTRVRDRELQLA